MYGQEYLIVNESDSETGYTVVEAFNVEKAITHFIPPNIPGYTMAQLVRVSLSEGLF